MEGLLVWWAVEAPVNYVDWVTPNSEIIGEILLDSDLIASLRASATTQFGGRIPGIKLKYNKLVSEHM